MSQKRYWWTLFIGTLLLLTLLVVLLRGTLVWHSVERDRAFLQGSMAAELDATAALFVEQSQFLQEMVRVLARDVDLLDWLEQPDADRRFFLEQNWLTLADQFKVFNQVRFLDTLGWEKIRVDYDRRLERGTSVDNLSYKGSRPYFVNAMGLKNHEVMLSRIDLNMEQGRIVFPIQPTIRVISPVEAEGQRLGYLVVNVSLEHFKSTLNQVENILGTDPFVVDEQGYFIQAPEPGWEWGMLLPDRMDFNLQDMYPSLWQSMHSRVEGEVELSAEQAIFYKRVEYGQSSDGSNVLYLLTPLNKTHILSRISSSISIINWATCFSLIVAGFIAMQLATTWTIQRQQKRAQILSQAALESMSGVMITDASGFIHTVNHAFCEVTGFSQDDVLGQTPQILKSNRHDKRFYRQFWHQLTTEGYWKGEIWNRRKNGEIYPQLMTVKAIRNGRGTTEHYVANFSDLSAQKNLEAQLRELAETDPLTGLYNRRRFEEILTRELALASRYQQPLCLALMDVDHFKQINDSQGHDVGDVVLKKLSELGQATLRQTDCMARWGGEEFILLLLRANLNEAQTVVERLRCAIADDSIYPGLTCSFGLAQWLAGESSSELLKRADDALYQAKHSGRNRICCAIPAKAA